MKLIKNLFLWVFLLIPVIGYSQDCGTFYPLQEGTSFEMTSYDKKGKKSARSSYIINSFNDNVANISSTIYDKKDELVADTEFTATCVNDVVEIDVNYLVSPQLLEQYKDMEMTVSGDNLSIPNSLSVGQSLPDSKVDISVSINPINMKMNIVMSDRKVTGKESITTPAGTFECYVLTYKVDTKMALNISTSGKQWLAPKVGIVRDEVYNKSGKLTSYSELTAFNK